MLKVELATNQDIHSWLDLAGEVGALFGSDMAHAPDFQNWLRRNIERGSAYCVRVEGFLAGAMQFRNGWINWLAVSKRVRRQGVGRSLIEFAQASGHSEIYVTTFGLDHPHPEAESGRALYRAMNFSLSSEIPKPAPDGTPREILVWQAPSK